MLFGGRSAGYQSPFLVFMRGKIMPQERMPRSSKDTLIIYGHSNICCREIKEKPVIFIMCKIKKIFLNEMPIAMSICTSYSKANLQETYMAVELGKPVHYSSDYC